MRYEYFIQSPIATIRFAGFESNTLNLHRQGWAISAEQFHSYDYYRERLRLALRHEASGVHMLTAPVPVRDILDSIRDGRVDLTDVICFDVVNVFTDGLVRIMPQAKLTRWSPIDPEPSFEPWKEMKFTDWVPFKTINPDAPEIYVDQATVPELMEIILKKQDPRQKEIREKQRKAAWREQQREFDPRKDIQAQIVSLAL